MSTAFEVPKVPYEREWRWCWINHHAKKPRRCTRGLALFRSKNGQLVHRVRYASLHTDGASNWRLAAQGYCGQSCHHANLLPAVNDGDWICQRCETAAIKNGHKPFTDLIGADLREGHCKPGTVYTASLPAQA